MVQVLPTIQSPVIYLEMCENPQLTEVTLTPYACVEENMPDVGAYLHLYREIGRDYLWNYRPGQSREAIQRIIQSPNTRLYYLMDGENPIGMAECDISKHKDIEIVHFGLLPGYTDRGLGWAFLQQILFRLWQMQPDRVHLSSCGLDHPKAITFYEKAGFRVYRTAMGEFKDYRYSDFYHLEDAPEIPHGQRLVDRQNHQIE